MNKAWALLLLAVPVTALTCKVDFERGCEDGACTSASSSGAGGGCIAPVSDPDKHGFPDDVYAVLTKNCYGCHGDPLMPGVPHTFLYFDDTQDLYHPKPACEACLSLPFGEQKGCMDAANKAAHDADSNATPPCRTWWSQMREHAISNPENAGAMFYTADGRRNEAMPLMKPPIAPCEMKILSDWLNSCGTDPTDLTSRCACTPGSGSFSKDGGSGGAGSSSSSSASSASGTGGGGGGGGGGGAGGSAPVDTTPRCENFIGGTGASSTASSSDASSSSSSGGG